MAKTVGAGAPNYRLSECIHIPAGTSDVTYYADDLGGTTTQGDRVAALAGSSQGPGERWAVDAILINLKSDATLAITIIATDADGSTSRETLPIEVYTKGMYLIPVAWQANATGGCLKVTVARNSANSFIRLLGVRKG